METIAAARARVEVAKSEHDNAVLNLARRKRIRGSISIEEFDQALFAEKSAKANLDAAHERLSELESGTRKEKVDAQLSAVQQLEASLKEIDVALSKSRLLAPFAGIITRRYLDPGSIAQASVPVVKLVEQQHLEAWIGLPVSIARDIEPDSEHQILVDRIPFQGKVAAKIQELDTATHTQTVLFTLEPAASEKVVSGQICEIAISSSVDTSGCWVPTSALSKGVRGLWTVMVMVKDKTTGAFRIEKRGIEIIKTAADRVLTEGTIEDGDQIVVNGTHRITDGQLVVPTD
jgi:RND family efflux transporter MFP subunit